jgi:hypothetical protein
MSQYEHGVLGMQTGVRFVAQHYNVATGKTLDESILGNTFLSKASTLKELGYLHIEQIDFLKKIQDFKIKHQIILSSITTCPLCNSPTKKAGTFKSQFHAALTDHDVAVQRTACKCGWFSASSVEGIYGSSVHPDLLAKQALQGSKESYEKSSQSLNAESVSKRAVNGHMHISRSVQCVAEQLETTKRSKDYGKSDKKAEILLANIDGGHIKSRGDNRSFEAMVATVYRPESLEYVDKNHNRITSKMTVASAKDDGQETMKELFKSACRAQGMTAETKVTCLADGADNCWSIAHSIEKDCQELTFILDWFHISMKFTNIAIPDEHKALYDKVKWHLWHGHPDTALIRLEELTILIEDNSKKTKLNKLVTYIGNNKNGIVNYSKRQKSGLVYTSNLAESTVNTLINERQKGKQKMLWSRDGAHNVLQVRASVFSNSWDDDWEKIEQEIYKKAA